MIRKNVSGPILVIIFLIQTFWSIAGKDVRIAKPSDWVVNVDAKEGEIVTSGENHQYILIDRQDNIGEEESFRHFAYKILNSEGVQNMSDISIDFDPSFQTLTFHSVQIIRDNQIIDQLSADRIQTIQREANLERLLYDGSLTAIVNLSDVRVDDIIEFSYSRKGYNPINNGHIADVFYFQFTSPVSRVYQRLLKPRSLFLAIEPHGLEKPAKNNYTDAIDELVWDIPAYDFSLFDANTPSWYDVHRRIEVSTFRDWSDVVNWALPLYKYSLSSATQILQQIDKGTPKSEEVLTLIRFVQDEIRYLGFESGIGAYKPNDPSQVYQQRYGDCKDKSLLLVSLLNAKGIEAYPMLVNTIAKHTLDSRLPGHTAFNHCVVYFKHEGQVYYVDPTINNQGGDLQTMVFPDYNRGLILKPGNASLTVLPKQEPPKVSISEMVEFKEIGGSATFYVRTEYTGSKSDYIRSYFSNNAKESIQKEYENFYSNLYPGIKTEKEVKLLDYDRNSTNKLIVEEYYTIDPFWNNYDGIDYAEVYPLVLETITNYDKTASRTMPYFLGAPNQFEQTSSIILPEPWSVSDENSTIVGPGFSYDKSISYFGNTILVNHKYSLKDEYIDADSASVFIAKNNIIRDNLSFQLTYNQDLDGFRWSWVAILLCVLAIVLGVYFSRKIYIDYNPEPWKYAEEKTIGGWLILPAIGLCLSPIIILYQQIELGYFNQNTWVALGMNYPEKQLGIWMVYGAEIIYNVLFLIFNFLVLTVFFQRRTSAPRLVIIFYALNLAIPLIDNYVLEILIPDFLSAQDQQVLMKETVRSFIAAAIWIPYFSRSERVKSTFYRKRTTLLD